MIEEVDEQDDNLTISNKNSMVEAGSDPKKKETLGGEDEEEKDFDFEVPDRLKPTERDGTTMKKKKSEVVDVLA